MRLVLIVLISPPAYGEARRQGCLRCQHPPRCPPSHPPEGRGGRAGVMGDWAPQHFTRGGGTFLPMSCNSFHVRVPREPCAALCDSPWTAGLLEEGTGVSSGDLPVAAPG